MSEAVTTGPALIYSGEITDELVTPLIKHISTYKKDQEGGQSPILIINSTGGDIHSMMAAVDWVRLSTLIIIATGACMSAAVPILAAGSMRFATKSTRFMIHAGQFSLGEDRTPKTLRSEIQEIDRNEKLYLKMLAKDTKYKTERWWSSKCKDSPLYFDVKQAKEWGIIDGILEKVEDIQ